MQVITARPKNAWPQAWISGTGTYQHCFTVLLLRPVSQTSLKFNLRGFLVGPFMHWSCESDFIGSCSTRCTSCYQHVIMERVSRNSGPYSMAPTVMLARSYKLYIPKGWRMYSPGEGIHPAQGKLESIWFSSSRLLRCYMH